MRGQGIERHSLRWLVVASWAWILLIATLGPLGEVRTVSANSGRGGPQRRAGDHVTGREFYRGYSGTPHHSALEAPRHGPNKHQGRVRSLKPTNRKLGGFKGKGAGKTAPRGKLKLAGTVSGGAKPRAPQPMLAFEAGGGKSTTSAFKRPARGAGRGLEAGAGKTTAAKTKPPVKRVRLKPTYRNYQIDEDNSVIEFYGRNEAGDAGGGGAGGKDVAMGHFNYNRISGKVELQMPPPEIAANGDQISKQFTSGGKAVAQNEYFTDFAAQFARHYNNRKLTEINFDFGGGVDAPDPRYDELVARTQELQKTDPALSWDDATRQAFAAMEPGVVRALEKHGYSRKNLKISIMPPSAEGHGSFRVTTGERPKSHTDLSRFLHTMAVVFTFDLRKPGIMKEAGKAKLDNIVHGITDGVGFVSTYTKKQTKIGKDAYALTLTAQAKGKRKQVQIGTIGVTKDSIEIGPLNSIVIDETTGQQTALIADGMLYEQVALREGIAAYKGKTAPVIRQVIAGALPEMISQRAQQRFASDKALRQRGDAGYQQALVEALFDLVPITKDLAQIGYDITNAEVKQRGDGYLLLQFAP